VTEDPGCKAFFVIDEISLLDKFEPKLLIAIRRALRLLKTLPIWTFLLDTSSGLAILAPAAEDDGSGRVVQGNLHRVDPFFSLSIDLEIHRRLQDPKLREKELQKSLSEFATVKHMSLFGRPLWAVYQDHAYSEVLSAVKMKLLGGREQFDPQSKDHVFAVLASRVCLTPCIRKTEANELSKVAVSSHLRLISSIDLRRGRTLTVTPSEPLVSDAAAHCLSGKWPSAIRVLTRELLSPGLLEPGLGGELLARILFIMAKDATAEDSKAKMVSYEGPPYSAPIMLCDFLKRLFGDSLDNLPPNFTMAFQDARVNFNHFVNTDRRLHGKRCETELLHKLLYSNAALQLVGNQPHWDLLIPVYLGDPTGPFETTRLTSLVVQIKNRVGRKCDFDIHSDSYNMVSNGNNPILSLQLEFGVAKPGMDYKFDDHIYAIRVTGKGCRTYDFLCPEEESALGSMFSELSPSIHGTVMEKAIGEHYAPFNSHRWESCGAGPKRSIEQVGDTDQTEVRRKKKKFGPRSE
jgi:hypothetical protein